MTFTPKFVDLVRNLTSAQGTGAISLGAAVSGFTGFTEALSTGDQFYYCIQGVDKPAEREVGRGTLLAGGKVGRDPIGGVATNFSTGTKTIALVAAAEWFAKLENGGSGSAPSMAVASRAALAAAPASRGPAMLTEARREGLFVFDPSDQSARVALDSDQGLTVAPTSDATGVSGAWVRQFHGAVMADWFGLAGDDATDDGPKVRRILDVLRDGRIGNQGSRVLQFGPRKYYLGTSALNLRSTTLIEGVGRYGTQLRWGAGACGIIVQRVNSPDGLTGQTGSISGGGDYSIIRHMTLRGGYVSDALTPEGAFHGVALRARAQLDDVTISGFQGDGLYCSVAAGSPVNEGNANCAFVTNCQFQLNRNGVYVDSADANAMTFVNCDASSNRQWGFWDSSFLGNCYTGCHTAANGWDGAISSVPTGCTFAGNRYGVVPGQESWCAANAPTGTPVSNQGWLFLGSGGTYSGVVAWANGTAFRAGGGYYLDGGGGNQGNALTNCYSEGDQNPTQAAGATLFLQGQQALGVYSGINPYPGWLKGDGLYLRSNADLQAGRDLDVARNANVGGTMMLQGNLGARGTSCSIGPNSGAPAPNELQLNFTDYLNLPFHYWSGGINYEKGYLRVFTTGVVLNAESAFVQKIGNSPAFAVDGTGLDLASGKALKVNGNQVIGARGAALPADATDLVSAIALVNAVKARLKTTGGHGLVAD